jgi:hypothetical protein
MNPLTQIKKISVLPLVIALALVVRAVPAAAQANEVTHWNRIATDTLVAFPPPAGGAPPALYINMGMTQGAVYDALNAIEPRYRPYLLETRFDPSASKEAATATAAYRVLSNIVSTVPDSIPFPNRQQLLDTLATEYANSLDAIPDGPPKTFGIDAGNAAADAMIAARQGDGRFGPSPWVPNYEPGHWQPLLNPDGTPILDPTPWVGGVLPFLMQSSSQFRTDGPNALTSTAYAEDFNEVKALGRLDSTVRTPEQTHIAIFWQSPPAVERRRPGPNRRPAICGGHRRQRSLVRDDEPERRGRGDQLLERQVLLGLLAALDGDPAGGRGRQPGHRARPVVDVAPNGALPRAPVGTPLSRRRNPRGAAKVLRHGQDPVRRDEQSLPRRNALLRPVLGSSQGDHRRPHLGGPALPHCRRTGEGSRQESGPLHGEALLPAARLTLSGVGPQLAAPRRAGWWFRDVPAESVTNNEGARHLISPAFQTFNVQLST